MSKTVTPEQQILIHLRMIRGMIAIEAERNECSVPLNIWLDDNARKPDHRVRAGNRESDEATCPTWGEDWDTGRDLATRG